MRALKEEANNKGGRTVRGELKKVLLAKDEQPSQEMVHKVQEIRIVEENKLVKTEGNVRDIRLMYISVDGLVS